MRPLGRRWFTREFQLFVLFQVEQVSEISFLQTPQVRQIREKRAGYQPIQSFSAARP
jgi:hypothetical protein